jgi:Mn2+/Fe2+ NRAMP family transporter
VHTRLGLTDLRNECVHVVTGALMMGVIGASIVIACTVHASGRSIEEARDAAAALEPLAGNLAAAPLGVGLLGAAMLAASVLPLSTAYSISEALGRESALDDSFAEAPVFDCS